jgi:transcription elongation factor GreA
MKMTDEYYLTAEGEARLRAELEQLTGSAREEMAGRLRSAIQMGDLSENADYHKAKEDQGFLEGRIQELEYLLQNVVIIDEMETTSDQVSIGSRVTIQEDGYPPETYRVVGAKEADPTNGLISNESPIGQAIIGKKEGESAVAETPGGQITLKVIKIE